MSLDVFKNGHKAYYDEVPRYKRPLFNSTTEAVSWEAGWDSASSEHDLFTENQLLKTQLSDMALEEASAHMYFKAEKAKLVKSTQKMISIIGADSQTIINYRDFMNKRDDQLNALIDNVSKLNKFTFSREKMITAIKLILNQVHSHLEVISPEVEKKKSK